mmetsp:Transcript_64560/g.97284  ORF Transcript_64560/g.97284 Transcript_64560/m.97284 type:complete len:359 (+) Transcript_64560:97-1173(+)|eukprot:CAMPEP_0117005522 /NCGR_PEP_ID=MMETSP0472-20121206/6104_1 /TAXON_ID=693140 ORGANISM="Tiarina fusus, Strain LIS" /NCGR_SAMPLE_ID=MMETSP0472 /ASSEMBLY_ACC=CAM_ASM_000603 /LENGTH=358 /DNA_ID=CAMNT_0004706779 /DNA_START=84 /DNA_END=1160 /DNA_ORIENTATION=+
MSVRELLLVAALLLTISNVANVEAFVGVSNVVVGSSLIRLDMAGRGMGMGTAQKAKKNKKNSVPKKNGMGAKKTNAVATFDVNASVIRLEKRYEEIMKISAKSIAKDEEDPRWASSVDEEDDSMTTEYVIAARADSKQGAVRDWVPIAQICVQRPEKEYENTKEILQEAISCYCRELSYTAAFCAPVFSTVARNVVQYAVEPMDSFHKHVYERVVEQSGSSGKTDTMTKSTAKEVLGLDDSSEGTIDKADIKQAYRKLSFQLHPDRFEGTEEECKEAAECYAKVQLAFDTLSSGVRVEGSSWYQSLGGKARTDFVGPVNLMPLGAAQAQMERRGVKAAMLGLDPELVQSFVARNLGSQ